MGKTISQLKAELEALKNLNTDIRVYEVFKAVTAERKPLIDAIEREIETLRASKPKTLRWPENTPERILEVCQKYWSGTTESFTFRIHLWNSKAIWTSYPSGGYSDNGGWNPTPVNYDLINIALVEASDHSRPNGIVMANIARRTSKKELSDVMFKKTGERPT